MKRRIETKKPKGIRLFLRDTAAISPVIATLILLVIAAVAAAGVGLLTQKAQDNANSQTTNKNLGVSGTFSVKGSNILQELTQSEVSAFRELYPAIIINVGAGNSAAGRALVFNKQIDVGGSAEIWQDDDRTDTTTGLQYDGRPKAVIQAAGLDSFVYETKIGTGSIVVAGNLKASDGTVVGKINVVNQSKYVEIDLTNAAASWDKPTATLTINFSALKNNYSSTGNGKILSASINGTTAFGNNIQLVEREDEAAHEAIFAKWIGLADPTTKQLTSITIPN